MLNIETKEDSAEKLAAVQGKPTKHYLFAAEFNSIVNKVNEFDNFINPDRILSLGTETIDGNNYTYQGYSWQIGGVSYLMVVPEVITIPAASVGFKRKDIAVFTSSGTIVRVPGTETDADIVASPDVPEGTLYFKSYDIDGNTIAVDPEPIVIDGSQFKKKAESQSVTLSLNFESGKLPLLPNGASYYKVQSLELVELTGFSRDLLTGDTTDEPPYEGKEYWFENNTPNPISLLNNSQPTDAFKLNASTLVVPSGGRVMFKFISGYFQEMVKLWSDEGYVENLKQKLIYYHDFVFIGPTVNSVWNFIGSSAGNAQVAVENYNNNHPSKRIGLLRLAVNNFDGSRANCIDMSLGFKSAKGLFNYYEIAFYSFTHSNIKARLGFRNSDTTATPKHGVFVDVDNTGLVTLFCINNNFTTSIPVTTILRASSIIGAIFYKFLILYEEDDLIRLIIRDDNDNLIVNQLVATNIPNMSPLGQGLTCFTVTAPGSLTNVALLDKVLVGGELPQELKFML